MKPRYWERALASRYSRRTVLVGGASLSGAAALLAACGGGGSSDSPQSSASGINVFTETKEEGPVKTGGVYKKRITENPPSLDPYKQTAASPNTDIGTFIYNRLVSFKIGPGVDFQKYEVAPELVDKWEITDGGLTYIFKLKPNVKFHDVAPVNGHALEGEDVASSYKRFSVGLTGGVGGALAGTVGSPSFGNSFKGLVESVTAPDKSTVVWKLTKPNAAFLNILGSLNFFWIYPREADVSYDPTQKVIGTGPFIFDQYVPSVRMEYVKNPAYFEKGLPHMDGVTTFIIPESAQNRAQFAAGSLQQYTPTDIDDFLQLVRGDSSLRILDSGIDGSTQGVGFGREDPNGPFMKDVRMRRALSLAIDRTLMIEELNDIEKYRQAGLDRKYRLGNFVPADLSTYWVEPRGPEMKEGAEWFQYDPQKAKQLVSAAGMEGYEFAHRYASRNQNSALENNFILDAEWEAVGLKPKSTPEDYASLFNPHSWHGECTGVACHGWQTFGDPAQQLDYLFGPSSTRNQMGINDPKFNEMQARNLAELDTTKRRAIILEMLQYLAVEMRHIPYGYGSVNSFVLFQQVVRNNNAYRSSDSSTGANGQNLKHWWLNT
jgi:peptide/nickel transport system substrate-binding protein